MDDIFNLKIKGTEFKVLREALLKCNNELKLNKFIKHVNMKKVKVQDIEIMPMPVSNTFLAVFLLQPDGIGKRDYLKKVNAALDNIYKKRSLPPSFDMEVVEKMRQFIQFYLGKVDAKTIKYIRMGVDTPIPLPVFEYKSKLEKIEKQGAKTPKKVKRIPTPSEISQSKPIIKDTKQKGVCIREIRNITDTQGLFIRIENGVLFLEFECKKNSKYLPPAPYVNNKLDPNYYGKVMLDE